MHVMYAVTTCSVSEVLPTGQLSNVPWRRMGVKYTNNEAYFDVIEEIDAIIDKSGSTVFAEIQGYVSYTVLLTLVLCNCMDMNTQNNVESSKCFTNQYLDYLCKLL